MRLPRSSHHFFALEVPIFDSEVRLIMISSLRRATVAAAIVASVLVLVAGCASQSPSQTNPTPSATPSATPSSATSLTYSNARYGFTFTLPLSWTGYAIVNTTWQGWSSKSGKVVETGPLLSIRHPLWTAANKRQDIPILIYTLAQWSALGKEVFNMGAAPIPPSELGRNAKYVFALPARYNYAFPTGYQEVDQILQGKPLHAI